MDYYSEPAAQPVLAEGGKDESRTWIALVVTEPAPGELMITGPRPSWRRLILPALVLTASVEIVFATAMGELGNGSNDWVFVLLLSSLIAAVVSVLYLSKSRAPDAVWLMNDTLRVSPRSRLWKTGSTYTKDELNDVVARRYWGLRPGRSTLYLEMDVLRITVFANCPREDVQAVAEIIRDRLGMNKLL